MEEKYKNIESYLGNTMSPENRIRFEANMAKDDLLKEEVRLYEKLNFHLKQDSVLDTEYIPDTAFTKKLRVYLEGEESKYLKEKIKSYSKSYKPEKKKYSFGKYSRIAALLVILILGTIALEVLNKKTPEQLYALYYKETDLPPLIKRDNNELNFLYKGITSFKSNNYDQALEDFENYQESNTIIDTAMFLYKGMTHLYLNESKEAIVTFDLVANSQLLIKSKGLWFKALGYLKNSEIDKAKEVLSIIVKNPENFNFKKAKKMLDDL